MERIADVFTQARRVGVERLDAQLLLSHRLGRPRSWLLAHVDERLDGADAQWLHDALAGRAGGEPLAYLLGEWEFGGRGFTVTPAVLIPRPETELLVEWALQVLAGPLGLLGLPRLADLGTGSGVIAISLAAELARQRRDAIVVASDQSAAALAVATGNAARHGVDVSFSEGDWWVPLAGRRFDLVVSNPPYIARDDPHLTALGAEPLAALASGSDGLDALSIIVSGAPEHLQPHGWLLLEHGHDQGAAVRSLLERTGFIHVETRRDLAGLDRCTGGRLRS
jgi:release factor glutamine methyltransferase